MKCSVEMLIEWPLEWKPTPQGWHQHNRFCVESSTYRWARLVLSYHDRRENEMLFTIAVILLVLWLLGLVTGYTMGNFIYVLLVIALVLFVVGLVSGRRTV